MTSRKPIYAMLAVGVAAILALTFLPYSLAQISQAGRDIVATVVPSTPQTDAQTVAAPPERAAPSFDVASWYELKDEGAEFHGVLVETLDGRHTLAAHNADNTFNPASLIKLTTTLVALKRLGADYRFETHVYADGTIDDAGKLNGKIYVAGGDPTFGDVAAAMIARELRARGINSATEGVVVSPDFCFNYSESPEESAKRLIQAMKLGDTKNVEDKRARQSKREEKSRQARRGEKPGEGDKGGADAKRDKSARANKSSGTRQTEKDRKSAQEKEESPQEAANEQESDNGQASGKQQGDETPSPYVAQTPPGGKPLFALRSYPLREILLYMNAHSSNFVAERLGALLGGPSAIERYLVDELKLPAEQVTIERASGREHNRMTPRGLLTVIRALNAEAGRQGMKLEDIMPVASDDVGTLRRRLHDTPLEGSIVGKTGTLTHEVDGGMASLAGIVYTQNAGIIVFAILDQGSHISENRELEDQLLNQIITSEDTPINISRDTPRRILPSTSLEIISE